MLLIKGFAFAAFSDRALGAIKNSYPTLMKIEISSENL